MLFVISYDLKSPGKDYSSLYEVIKSFGAWWHYLDSTWIIRSQRSVSDISDLIRQRMDANDRLIVAAISVHDTDGWLPQKAWDWIRENDKS